MTDDTISVTGGEELRQRLRCKFAKGSAIKYISHLDLARAWERTFRRAGLPLLYSQGFTPRPRFQIAAGLPVGVTSRAELLDVWLRQRLEPEEVLARLRAVSPPGLEVVEVVEVDLKAAALQSQICAADYQAAVRTAEALTAIQDRVGALLAAPTLPRRRLHKGEWQTYDLRPFIHSITVMAGDEGSDERILVMRLLASQSGAGRPDEVLDALGLSLLPHSVERIMLHFQFDN
jgi:radical SAM-linked protein